MNQLTIVLIIIALSIAYTIFSVVKNLKKKEKSSCGDCNGCDIKNEITKNVAHKVSKNPTTCGSSRQC